MKLLPETEITLGGVLRCSRHEIAAGVWQAHVVKHPLGRDALCRSGNTAPWNGERWDALTPPVVTEEQRAALVETIRALGTDQQRCGARELWGKASKSAKEPCYECGEPLVNLCFKKLNAAGTVGKAYAEQTEALLRSFSDAVTVPRKALWARLMGFLRTPEKLEGLSVLHVGLDRGSGSKPIARASGHDGVVVELYLHGRSHLVWRTTYREPQALASVANRVSFLQRAPAPDNRIEVLSDAALVTRGWWETHGA